MGYDCQILDLEIGFYFFLDYLFICFIVFIYLFPCKFTCVLLFILTKLVQ